MSIVSVIGPTGDLVHRIRGEYLEMPGLRLSVTQAQRLWGLSAEACQKALDALVEGGFLRRTAEGQYTRLTEGSVTTGRRVSA